MVQSPHLVVNFKLLNHPEFQKHPERRGDHGIIVQGKVVKVKLVNAQLTAQGDFSRLKERGQWDLSIKSGLNMLCVLKHIILESLPSVCRLLLWSRLHGRTTSEREIIHTEGVFSTPVQIKMSYCEAETVCFHQSLVSGV